MSTLSEEARAKAKDKVERLIRSDPRARVDASGYSPDGPMDAGAQTGPRPISRRQFRRGGKVAGEAAAPRADRKPRATGGRTKVDGGLINEDIKQANEEREGTKHVGGMKKGGRIGRTMGGMALPAWADSVQRKDGGKVHADEAQDRELIHKMGCKCGKCSGGRVGRREGGRTEYEANRALTQMAKPPSSSTPGLPAPKQGGDPYNTAKTRAARKSGGAAINDGTRPVAGRLARKGGGRTKAKTNVNIIIAPQGQQRPAMPPMGGAPPPAGGPVGLHQGAPPPAPVIATPPAGAPPPMMRNTGGRTLEKDGGKLVKLGRYPIDAGAGGGLGRLEKAERAARG